MAWQKVKLGDIASFSNGVNFGKDAYAKGVKLIGVSNFGNRVVPDYSELEEISSNVLKDSDYLKDGDIVFVRSNGNKELVGRCMLIENPQYAVTYSGFCIRARFLDKKVCSPKFFNYYFKTDFFRRSISGAAVGANIQNLNQGILSNHVANVPNFGEQQKIADILSAYDDLIENNQKQIKLLEEAAQRLYKQWFIDLRYPGHETIKIVDGLPEGWHYKPVNSIVSLLSGYAFKSDSFSENGRYKIVTIKNVQDGVFDGENVSLVDDIPPKMPTHCVLNNGDVLLSLTGNVGRVCMVVGENYLLNQRVAKLKSDYPSFTYCIFRSKDMYDEMNNLANGAAQQNLSPIRTGQIKIAVPPSDILELFENDVNPIIAKILLLNKQNKSLSQSRDRLLPKLMNGELEI